MGGTLFIWAGAVLSISFLEAPLKFTAPGITLPLGLGIGRIVFQALHRLEWLLALLTLALCLRYWPPCLLQGILATLLAILLTQTLWLMPILDTRAEVLLNNPEASATATYHHWLYIVLECIKLVALLVAGVLLGKNLIQHDSGTR
ncbi:MAG: hypothetical protein KF690_02395 [Bacteroidetes bacterium]|nr:hypothetical protein [Bacteroidota bacterium]